MDAGAYHESSRFYGIRIDKRITEVKKEKDMATTKNQKYKGQKPKERSKNKIVQ